jgi:hypothetical protein
MKTRGIRITIKGTVDLQTDPDPAVAQSDPVVIEKPYDGTALKESEFWSTGGRRCPEELRLDQTRTRKLLDGGDRSSYEWGPWPRRH